MSQNFDPNQNYYFFNKKNTIPIVFIHGVGLDHQMWGYQINYFNEYSTLTYDLLGHGKTSCKKDKLSLKDFSNQLLEILDHLGVEKINLIGFSLASGTVAQTSLFSGFNVSIFFLEDESTHSPLIYILKF